MLQQGIDIIDINGLFLSFQRQACFGLKSLVNYL